MINQQPVTPQSPSQQAYSSYSFFFYGDGGDGVCNEQNGSEGKFSMPPLVDQEDVRVVRSLSVAAVEVKVPVTDKMEAKNLVAAAAADVVEFMPPLTDQENARIARSSSSSPSRAALTASVKGVLLETFHMSEPTVGDFTVGQRVVGSLGVQIAGGGTTGRECKGIVTYIGKILHDRSGEVWIGVCFDDVVGKHDGSVEGKTYFKCCYARSIC